jgi:hypothetical protein
MITPDDILLDMLQTGQITFEEYIKSQELPSETINRLRKAIEEYETNRK